MPTATIPCVKFQEPPFMMFKNPNDTSESEDNLEGYCKDLIDKVMTSIGHEYSIRLVKDKKYGAKDASVQSGWNGMMGEILRKVSRRWFSQIAVLSTILRAMLLRLQC